MELMCFTRDKVDKDQSAIGKRKRAPNFTDKEVRILIKLIHENIQTIESRKTDSEAWKMKDIAWNIVTEEFNNSLETTKRSTETLRQKYDNIKKNLRKKESRNKEEENKENPEFIDLEDYEKELLVLLERCGETSEQVHKTSIIVLPEHRLEKPIEIKIENDTRSSHSSINELQDEKNEEQFIVTDDDFLWDLPDDMQNRPKMFLLKRQLEHLDRDEERKVREHEIRMKNEQIKRRIMLNKEKRAREEHKKKMELMALEIDLKKRLLSESHNIS